jgi:hypothetical protein
LATALFLLEISLKKSFEPMVRMVIHFSSASASCALILVNSATAAYAIALRAVLSSAEQGILVTNRFHAHRGENLLNEGIGL